MEPDNHTTNLLNELFKHEDITYVKQGIEIFASLDLSTEQLHSILPWKESVEYKELQQSLSIFPQSHYLAIWLLAHISNVKRPWTRKVKSINVGYNCLSELPQNIGSLIFVEQIKIINNKLNTLPDSLYSLPSVQELILSNNQLHHISKEIGNLKNVKHLDLSYNQLTTIPQELTELENLEYLSLSHNPLFTFPNIQGQDLRHLELSHCDLSTIPKNIAALDTLNISHNQIVELTDETLGIKNITYTRNPLQKVPTTIKHLILDKMSSQQLLSMLPNLPLLQSIDIRQTYNDVPTQLQELFYRFTFNNKGEIIWDCSIHCSYFQKATLLFIQFQAICDLAEKDPNKLGQLRKLSFLNSRLKRIPTNIGSLALISSLDEIDLRYCQVQSVPSTIAKLQQLSKLKIEGNPLSEDTKQLLHKYFSKHILSI
jgi:Leucine-rich repeat (LRR) protein